MPRNPAILEEISKVDALLAESGVREYCLACIQGPKGGCCHPCVNLSATGCVDKPLSCALWLCRDAEKAFPKVAAELFKIKMKYPYEVGQGYRLVSITHENLPVGYARFI